MGWFVWTVIGWALCGLLALAMQFRDKPAMRLNVGWAEVWPTFLGPFWLVAKIGEWSFGGQKW
jgi:hypothetical protein